MPILSVYVDDETQERLEILAKADGRSVEELVEAAVAESAIYAMRGHRGGQKELPLKKSPKEKT